MINSFKFFNSAANFFSYENGRQIQDSRLLDLEILKETTDFKIFTYIQNVLNPTMKEVGHTIILENDDIVITHMPNMEFTWKDKKTGEVVQGMHGFETNANDFSTGKVYYYNSKGVKMSIDDFLEKTNYKETSDVVVIPIACTKEYVTYKYLKPESQKDKTITLKISEIVK